MINEYIRYRIPTDQVDAFLKAYEVAGTPLRESAHCLGYELSRCSEAPEDFILRIHWDSAAGHLSGFRGSPQFRTFLHAVQPFVPHIQEMRHYDLTPIKWAR